MNYKKIKAFLRKTFAYLLTLGLTASLITGCGISTSSEEVSETTAEAQSDILDTSDMFTDRDLTTDYEIDGTITLADGASTTDADGVTIDGDTVTITAGGTYLITGSLTDGQIIIETDDEKVELVLSDASIATSSAAAIFVKSADKVFITSAADTVNTISATGADETDEDTDSNLDGAIFSKSDLTIKGQGTLKVTSAAGNGIVCKDDLRITSGSLSVTAANHGIDANDSVRVADGDITIDAENDAIHVSNDDEDKDSFAYIEDGSLTLAAADDGIHADSELVIAGGTINVTESYEGLEALSIEIDGGSINITASDDGINAAGGKDSSGMGGFGGDMFSGDSDAMLTINDGSVNVIAGGDGIDSNGDLYINGGETYVSGPTDNGNTAVDYGDGCNAYMNGGILIASGSSGMAEQFSDESEQGVILLTFDDYSSESITITDSDGNVLASVTPSKEYNCLLISAPGVTEGGTYTVTAGGSDTEVTLEGMTYGSTGGGMGGMMSGGHEDHGGQMGGGMPGMNGGN